MHRALAELPLLEHALLTNELPWSKVRLAARVATRSDEVDSIAGARGTPSRELERRVRDCARSSAAPEELDLVEPETQVRGAARRPRARSGRGRARWGSA